MQQEVLLAVAGAAIVLLVGLLWLWRSLTRSPSQQAHEAAQDRAPPVEIGETYEFGITEFSDHHSGDRVAVGKVEGFVIFAEDVPRHAEVGDVVRAKVLSFNKGETSADATVVDVR
jgi:predicted RNA-binding protein with TRAM domain